MTTLPAAVIAGAAIAWHLFSSGRHPIPLLAATFALVLTILFATGRRLAMPASVLAVLW